MSNLNYNPTLAENVLNLWSHMVLGRLFLGCAGGQTFKERVCAQMCTAANERNFTLLPCALSSVFILPLKPLELDVIMSAGPSLRGAAPCWSSSWGDGSQKVGSPTLQK